MSHLFLLPLILLLSTSEKTLFLSVCFNQVGVNITEQLCEPSLLQAEQTHLSHLLLGCHVFQPLGQLGGMH